MSHRHNSANCLACRSLGLNRGRSLYACTQRVPLETYPAYDEQDITLYVANSAGAILEYDSAARVDSFVSSAQLVEAKRRAIEQGWLRSRSANTSSTQYNVNIENGDALERLKCR